MMGEMLEPNLIISVTNSTQEKLEELYKKLGGTDEPVDYARLRRVVVVLEEELELQQEAKVAYRRDMLKDDKGRTHLSTRKYGFIRLWNENGELKTWGKPRIDGLFIFELI